MSIPLAAPSQNTLLRLGVFGGWLLFTLMVIAISWTGSLLRGRPPAVGGVLVWNLGWMLWAGGTFVVVRLARKFPLERRVLGRSLATHAGLGMLVGIGMLAVEFLLNHAIELLWPGAPRANAFLGFILYKFHVYFLIYWMILGATRAYDFHRRFRETELIASQLEARLAQAQLHALKTQLQPHFLFNTHHAIISLMLKEDRAGAITMLTRLSDLLRVTLRATDQQVSSLHEELDTLELYLGIQRARYGERLEVRLEIEPAALIAEVPWLILQPLVENALKHGIDPLSERGVLRIQARIDGEQLHLTVSDNGPGFRPGFHLETHGGIGLRNTQARLVRLYGAQQSFHLGNTQPTGAEVRVTLPRRAFQPGAKAVTAASMDE